MSTATLAALYLIIGAALAIQMRTPWAAAAMLLLWPIWGPFALLPSKR